MSSGQVKQQSPGELRAARTMNTAAMIGGVHAIGQAAEKIPGSAAVTAPIKTAAGKLIPATVKNAAAKLPKAGPLAAAAAIGWTGFHGAEVVGDVMARRSINNQIAQQPAPVAKRGDGHGVSLLLDTGVSKARPFPPLSRRPPPLRHVDDSEWLPLPHDLRPPARTHVGVESRSRGFSGITRGQAMALGMTANVGVSAALGGAGGLYYRKRKRQPVAKGKHVFDNPPPDWDAIKANVRYPTHWSMRSPEHNAAAQAQFSQMLTEGSNKVRRESHQQLLRDFEAIRAKPLRITPKPLQLTPMSAPRISTGRLMAAGAGLGAAVGIPAGLYLRHKRQGVGKAARYVGDPITVAARGHERSQRGNHRAMALSAGATGLAAGSAAGVYADDPHGVNSEFAAVRRFAHQHRLTRIRPTLANTGHLVRRAPNATYIGGATALAGAGVATFAGARRAAAGHQRAIDVRELNKDRGVGFAISHAPGSSRVSVLDKAYRRFDPEADRQRRLGTYAGIGAGTALVTGDRAARTITRHVSDEGGRKARGIAFKPGNARRGAVLVAASALSGAGGLAAYRRGIDARNQPWN